LETLPDPEFFLTYLFHAVTISSSKVWSWLSRQIPCPCKKKNKWLKKQHTGKKT
jgi:hypothetical protein